MWKTSTWEHNSWMNDVRIWQAKLMTSVQCSWSWECSAQAQKPLLSCLSICYAHVCTIYIWSIPVHYPESLFCLATCCVVNGCVSASLFLWKPNNSSSAPLFITWYCTISILLLSWNIKCCLNHHGFCIRHGSHSFPRVLFLKCVSMWSCDLCVNVHSLWTSAGSSCCCYLMLLLLELLELLGLDVENNCKERGELRTMLTDNDLVPTSDKEPERRKKIKSITYPCVYKVTSATIPVSCATCLLHCNKISIEKSIIP